jgi:predicted RNA-binding Zn ribbon-like protein
MTVMSPEFPPSRAGSLPLIADDLALDFANTESGRGFPSHQNHLREAANVADWLAHAKALPAEEADWLRREVSERADLAADLLTQAIALREAIHDIGAAIGRRAKPTETALAALAALHARFVARAALAPGVISCRWRWSLRASPIEAALGPIALAAVTLFTEGDFHRIRECGGHACGWLFYDRSKNNRRRWCEMEVCGNRAKQRRLAARRRGA